MRFNTEWLLKMMADNFIVISNGSTFFGGPSETGVVFVSPGIMDKLTRYSDFDIHQIPYLNQYIIGENPKENGMEEMNQYLD